MSEKIAINLGNVQKTMLLPLWGRAVETRKEHPLLVDHTAHEMVEKIDYDFSTITSNISPLSQAAWIMRSLFVDNIIKAFLSQHPRGTVVNLGCGLETNFERVDNGLLTWYDLDLPDVIDLRKKFLKESERRKFLPSSFLEDAWFDQIRVTDQVLFIAAGVFYYFEESDIKAFFIRLADRFPGCEIVFDVSSPTGVKVANKRVIESAGLDERSYLKWGLKNTAVLTSWDRRFQLLETRFYFKHKGLDRRVKFAGFISDLLKIQYLVHMRLGKA
jgi:O-methyltransferase involved in polyketide biosynthesis